MSEQFADHVMIENQRPSVRKSEGGGTRNLVPTIHGVSPLLTEIQETARHRGDFLRPETALTNQIKGICRRFCGGDKAKGRKLYAALAREWKAQGTKGTQTLFGLTRTAYFATALHWQARQMFHEARLLPEKRLGKMARQLPIWTWAKEIRGIDVLSLALIVGETGDLSNYATHQKLWKRMGLAVINGERQRKIKGDKAKAMEHRICVRRADLMFVVSENLIRCNSQYKPIYDREKVRQKVEYPDLTLLHQHNKARRYMVKRFLKELWKEWRTSEPMQSTSVLSAAPSKSNSGRAADKP